MQVCTSLQTDNHASTPPLSFFTGRMPFLPPNQQRQSTEGIEVEQNYASTVTPWIRRTVGDGEMGGDDDDDDEGDVQSSKQQASSTFIRRHLALLTPTTRWTDRQSRPDDQLARNCALAGTDLWRLYRLLCCVKRRGLGLSVARSNVRFSSSGFLLK